MKIKEENSDNLCILLKIHIESKDYHHNVENVLRDYRRKAVIPGFRKGKAPADVVASKYTRKCSTNEDAAEIIFSPG